jgi:MoaA/NifB/PqqE/SkfB family radical SAM enzyme
MPLKDLKFAIDVLSNNGFSVLYLTGGETGLYTHLVDGVEYAKRKGMITSLTSNGSLSRDLLKRLSRNLDFLSVSVDHCNPSVWDDAKHLAGISEKARDAIWTAKALGIKVYGITFLNSAWMVEDVERIVKYVNQELGVSFSLCYPFVSTNASTFAVGLDLQKSLAQNQRQIRNMTGKILQMKLKGSDVATLTGYMKDVLKAHDGLPMRYPCRAGTSILVVDCNLDVFPCFKRKKLFNLRARQDLNLEASDNSFCDCKGCLANCFKEPSVVSGQALLRVVAEEFFSNPKFYINIITKKN